MPLCSAGVTRKQSVSRKQQAPRAAAVKKIEPQQRPRRASTARAMATLLEVMTQSDKDHVRVSAAKTILARLAAQEEKKMRTTKRQSDDQPARQAALDAIAQLLDELAAAKTAGVASAVAMDTDSATKPDHTRR